jgi:hypothetical protein
MTRAAVKVSRSKESDVGDVIGGCHVLTYAEDGFSPLDLHARRFAIDREHVRAFARAVNDRSDVGSLHPVAPISAVPRILVRGGQDVDALAASISKFFLANRQTIKAPRLVFDFRMPSVPDFAIAALYSALQADDNPAFEEVLILEM